jgi:hypothetical protein
MFSLSLLPQSWGFLVDRTCFLCLLLMMTLLREWEFDEMKSKTAATEKLISCLILARTISKPD